MACEKLKQVMWLLMEQHPDGKFRRKEVEKAVMRICGVHPQTVKYNVAALLKIGWIKHDHYHYSSTGLIDTEDF